MNIILDKFTLVVTGVGDRNVSSSEFSIYADVSNVSKEVEYVEQEQKVDELGERLFILPQPDTEVQTIVEKLVKTTDVTDEPCVNFISKQVPLLDEDGAQVSYEQTYQQEIMETITLEDGSTVEQGTGTYETVGTGNFISCYVTELVQEQEIDESGNELYWTTVEEMEISYEPTPSLEIPESSELYSDDLEPVLVDSVKIKTITLVEDPTQFTISDLENYPTVYETILNKVKEDKVAELSEICNQTILSGYVSSALGSENTYDLDYEAQMNLSGMISAISNGMVTEPISWKASGIPQDHTIAQFMQLFGDGLAWKDFNIKKYWGLKIQTQNAFTVEEVIAIVW